MINNFIHLQLQRTGGESGCPPGGYRPAWCRNHNSIDWLAGDVLGFMEPAPPEENKRQYFWTINPSIRIQPQPARDESGGPPSRYRLGPFQNPNPHWLNSDWPGQGPPGGKRPIIVEQKTLPRTCNSNTPGETFRQSPGSMSPLAMSRPQPTDWLITDWLGFAEPAPSRKG